MPDSLVSTLWNIIQRLKVCLLQHIWMGSITLSGGTLYRTYVAHLLQNILSKQELTLAVLFCSRQQLQARLQQMATTVMASTLALQQLTPGMFCAYTHPSGSCLRFRQTSPSHSRRWLTAASCATRQHAGTCSACLYAFLLQYALYVCHLRQSVSEFLA